MNALNKYGWLFAVVALVLLLLLFMMPKPTATGSCDISCSSDSVVIPYEQGNEIDTSGVCPSTCDCCEITMVTEDLATDGWKVYYKCCNCVGDAELALPACDTSPLGPIYRILGMCV
jgi:hypothetical protein